MATVQTELPAGRAALSDLGTGLRTRKLVDATVLVTWSVAVGAILWLAEATWMIANVLLMVAPLVYILLRAPQVRTMIRWKFVLRFVLFITVFFDYLCVKYEAWGGPSLFPTVAGVNLEQVTWTALIILLALAVNEYFFSRQGAEPPSTVTRPILMAYFFTGLVIALVPPFNAWLADYTYLKIGLLLYPVMFVLVAIVIPSVLREVLLTGFVMSVFMLGFELLALHNGFWTFPGEYVGEVEILGYAFPVEEFVFMVCLCPAGVVATYALYKNWKSMATPFRRRGGKRSGLPRAALLLAGCSLVLLQACGSGGGQTSEEAGHLILLTKQDLPKGSEPAKEPPLDFKCSPGTFFKSFAEAVSTAPAYYLPDALLVQQAGVFEKPSEARRALRLLMADSAQRCLENKMQRTSLQMLGTRGKVTSRVLARHLPGVEAHAIRIKFATPLGWLETDQTFLLDGSALTVLGYISQNQPLKYSTWERVATAAAKRLNRVSESLEG